MNLINEKNRERLRQIGSQENTIDHIVVVKIFNPCGSGSWFVTELHEDDIAFGYVKLLENEWGYFSIKELEDLRCPPLNLPLEVDKYCGERTISEHCPELLPEIKRRQELAEMEKKKDLDKNLEL